MVPEHRIPISLGVQDLPGSDGAFSTDDIGHDHFLAGVLFPVFRKEPGGNVACAAWRVGNDNRYGLVWICRRWRYRHKER